LGQLGVASLRPTSITWARAAGAHSASAATVNPARRRIAALNTTAAR
jgi:hypothetical protein